MSKKIILAVLAIGAAALPMSGQTPAPRTASPAAINARLELRVTAVDGSEINLSKLRGKVVLLDFWATRCPPCIEELPKVLAIYKKFHDRGLEIIGISTDESREIVTSFVKARGMNWPQYLDENREISDRWHIPGLPTMWLIDRKGFLVNMDAQNDLENNVDKLLAQE